jgi:hypothetical protein
MIKLLMSIDGRFAIIENDIYQVAGAIYCGSFLAMKHLYSAEVEVITNNEMDEIYSLLEVA